MIKKYFYIFLPAFLLLLWWQLGTTNSTQAKFFFSSPQQIANVALADLQLFSFWQDIAYTGLATVTGLILGTLLGTVLGLILWSSPKFANITKPYMALLGAIPIFALAPMLIMWFGVGLWSKIIMAAFAVFLVATTQIYEGAQQASERYLLFAQSLAAKPWRIVRYIILPATMRFMVLGLNMNVGFALIGTFIGEFVSAQHGLGRYILQAGGVYDTARVLFGVAALAVLALLLRRVIAWVLPAA
jgi:NitT/TauT family transport system permease protein